MSHGPDKQESLDFLFAQVGRLQRSRMHALLDELGLYRGQPPVLFELWKQEGRTHSELADRLHVQPATMSKMIQRMERAGFVQRRSDPEDQRVSRVHLTEHGRAVQTQVKQVWNQIESEMFDGFTAEERAAIRSVILRIRKNMLRVVEDKCAPPPHNSSTNG